MILKTLSNLNESTIRRAGGRGGDLADPSVEFKWNLRSEEMTSNHEGKPAGGGISFPQFPSSLILPCSTGYAPIYPPLLQRLLDFSSHQV